MDDNLTLQMRENSRLLIPYRECIFRSSGQTCQSVTPLTKGINWLLKLVYM